MTLILLVQNDRFWQSSAKQLAEVWLVQVSNVNFQSCTLPGRDSLLESWRRTGTARNSEEFHLFIFRKDELHSWVSTLVLLETELSTVRHRFNFSVVKLGQLNPTWETQGSFSLSEPT